MGTSKYAAGGRLTLQLTRTYHPRGVEILLVTPSYGIIIIITLFKIIKIQYSDIPALMLLYKEI